MKLLLNEKDLYFLKEEKNLIIGDPKSFTASLEIGICGVGLLVMMEKEGVEIVIENENSKG